MKADGFRRAVMSLVGLTLIFSVLPVVGASAGSPSDQLTLSLNPVDWVASVGTCQYMTVRVVDANMRPVRDRFVDVEQVHNLAANSTSDDEPRVSFCVPSVGTNFSEVETDEGDLVETPDNLGTLGGETDGETDSNGLLTFGVSVSPANGSDGSGSVSVVAFVDVGGDDPDADEPQDAVSLTWESPAVSLDIGLVRSTHRPGKLHRVRVYAETGSGSPARHAPLTWKKEGVGRIIAFDRATDDDGEASAILYSEKKGSVTLTVAAKACANGGGPCEREVVLNWGPQKCTVFGTDGDDLLLGTSGQDVVCGFDGDDDLYSGRGHDVLIGGHGEDKLVAGGGNDSLKGKQGDDELYGQSGGDFLQGGSGVDYLIGGSGVDICRGGPSVEYVFRCN